MPIEGTSTMSSADSETELRPELRALLEARTSLTPWEIWKALPEAERIALLESALQRTEKVARRFADELHSRPGTIAADPTKYARRILHLRSLRRELPLIFCEALRPELSDFVGGIAPHGEVGAGDVRRPRPGQRFIPEAVAPRASILLAAYHVDRAVLLLLVLHAMVPELKGPLDAWFDRLTTDGVSVVRGEGTRLMAGQASSDSSAEPKSEPPPPTLASRLDQLEQMVLDLASTLENEAAELRSDLRAPASEVADALQAVRQAFASLSSEIVSGADPAPLPSLRAALADRENRARQQDAALALVGCIEELAAAQDSVDLLGPVVERAQRLREALSVPDASSAAVEERTQELAAVAQGDHPLVAFARLASASEPPPNEEQLGRRVADAFGFSVLTALLRERLVVPERVRSKFRALAERAWAENRSAAAPSRADMGPSPSDGATPQTPLHQNAPTDRATGRAGGERPEAGPSTLTSPFAMGEPARQPHGPPVEAPDGPVDGGSDPIERVGAEPSPERAVEASGITQRRERRPGAESGVSRGRTGGPRAPEAVVLLEEPSAEDPKGNLMSAGVLAPLSASGTAAELAREILAAGGEELAEALRCELVAALVREGLPALAYHVSSRLTDPLAPPTWLLGALTLAPELKHPAGLIEDACRQFFAAFTPRLPNVAPGWERGMSLLRTAAALRPSIFAPTSLASNLLRDLHFPGGGLDRTYELCEIVAENSVPGRALDPHLLSAILDSAAREESLRQRMQEAERWLEEGPRRSLLFGTDVWRKWHEPGQLLFNLLDPVRRNDLSQLHAVRALIDDLTDPTQVSVRASETMRLLQSGPRVREIEARALRQLQARCAEAAHLAGRWIAYHEAPNDHVTAARLRAAEAFHQQLVSLVDSAAAEARTESERVDCCVLEAAGAAALQRALAALALTLTDAARLSGEERPPEEVLNADLLLVTGIDLDPDWSIATAMEAVPDEIVLSLAAGLPNWELAYDQRVKQHDHAGTGLLLGIGERVGVPAHLVRALEEARPQRIAESRETLRRAADQARQTVEQATVHGLLSETDRARLMIPIERAWRALNEPGLDLRLRRLFAELRETGDEVARKREERMARLRDRIARLPASVDPAARTRIERAAAKGDVYTAEEFIGLVDAGAALPPAEPEHVAASHFDSFFPDLVRELDAGPMVARIDAAARVRARERLGPLDFSQLTESQAETAAQALEHWARLARSRGGPIKDSIKTLFTFFGFEVRGDPKIVESGNRSWVDVWTRPVQDRAQCPVQRFGSGAAPAGQDRAVYRVLCVWDEPSADDLISAIRDNLRPTFVLYCGRLNESRRRSLAQQSRERHRTFLVIDDYLVLRLCAEAGSRMPLLFGLTLPFTYLEPFVTTAGPVPPELFYGRDRELHDIVDTNGPSLVYGGRQLGKTALLYHVERHFNNEREGRVALFIDLQVHGLGIVHPPEDLWPLLVSELRARGIPEKSLSNHAAPRRILDALAEWLEADGRRRLLLLLDEADRFLSEDAEFRTVGQLKGLMDRTGRRFKVVFSGLHNVQRTTRLANNPLVHLGRPIVIGPLYNGEWSQARALLEEPLRALGFRFESPDLVTRLLSHTNYYPSLIQLAGRHLLRRLTPQGQVIFDRDRCPPYVITAEHIEAVARDVELRHELRNRFIWTLDLDRRYRVVAFVMAERALALDVGEAAMTPEEIYEEALHWWPRGFAADRSEQTFRVLLDEMVDLRVLRKDAQGRYALLNENIILLLGTRQEIEAELVRIQDEVAPPPFEPAMHRRQPRSGNAPERRSPLTSEQEGRILSRRNGPAVLFGVPAAATEDIPEFLLEASAAAVHNAPIVDSRSKFQEVLDNAVKERAHEGVTVLLVGDQSPWDLEWVEDAAHRVGRLQAERRWLRVVFVAGPDRTWELLGSPSIDRRLSDHGVDAVSLGPWHMPMVARWLDALAIPADLDFLTRLQQVTGFWPRFLHEVSDVLREAPAGRWTEALEHYASTWSVPEVADVRRQLLGLGDRPEAGAVLDLLISGDTVQETEMAEFVGESELRHALAWFERLRLADREGRGVWRPNPALTYLG